MDIVGLNDIATRVRRNTRQNPRLMPYVRPWIGRKCGEENFNVTHMVSGYGNLRKYVQRMGKTIDDTEHTVFGSAR